MEDISTFGPSVVVAVGLDDESVESLQTECSQRKIRLIVAGRQADLPLSVQCDHAIIGTLLPDGDGRKLATDFVQAGASVMMVGTANSTALADAWAFGAVASPEGNGAADWLDELAEREHVETVSRAGKLMEAQRLAESVTASAVFSGATGVPVSFVRIRPKGESTVGLDEALDRLTSVVGMTTVFYDAPFGERLALVVNGDRRRLLRLLDDPKLDADTEIAVVEVTSEDDVFAALGRSALSFGPGRDEEDRPRVLVALGQGQDKISETLRAALHRLNFAALFWDAAFRFEDPRGNAPVAAIVDAGLADQTAIELIKSSLAQDAPIPVVGLSGEDHIPDLQPMLDAGALDFLIWPFSSGDVQASVARAVTMGAEILAARVKESAPVQDIEEGRETLEDEPASAMAGSTGDLETHQEAADRQPAAKEQEADRVTADADQETPGNEPALEEQLDETDSPSLESALAEVVARRLVAGESVTFEGLGVLEVRHETSRIIHDEKGRTIVEPPRRSLVFGRENPADDDGSDS